MNLLFIYINPTSRTAIPPNISMLIGNIKNKRDYNIELFDTSFYKFNFGKPVIEDAWSMGYFLPVRDKIKIPQKETNLLDDLTEKVKDFRPNLIAVSCYSNQYAIARDLLIDLKEKFPEIPNIVGGPHPSFAPEKVISQPFIDMICVGEGEDSLLELCDKMESGGDITSINNIWLKEGKKIIINPIGKPTNLDELGDPDWSIFDNIHLYQPFHGKYFRVGMIEFGRGCPYRCTYCANRKYLDLYKEYKTSYFRHRDPALFIKKLKRLKERYNLELIYFQDGTFLTMSNDVLRRLATLYEEEINLPCIILTTANTINKTRLEYLKNMKCIYINMGIEEGNPEFRKQVLKRRMSTKQIVDAFELVRRYGIYTAAYNVIGFPYETRQDIFKTIELSRQCLPDSVYTQIFYPIEGTELRDICLEKGFFDPTNESLHSQILGVGNVSLLDDLPLSRQEIHGLLKTFYLYARMPKAIYPFIRLLEKDTAFSRKVISRLTKYYWKREPQFTDADSLATIGKTAH